MRIVQNFMKKKSKFINAFDFVFIQNYIFINISAKKFKNKMCQKFISSNGIFFNSQRNRKIFAFSFYLILF